MQNELRRSGFEDLVPAGIVLTGGTSKMEGAVELAEEIFHMPVRVGFPQSVKGLSDIVRNPIYATSVGLLQYGAEAQEEAATPSARAVAAEAGMVGRLKGWLHRNF